MASARGRLGVRSPKSAKRGAIPLKKKVVIRLLSGCLDPVEPSLVQLHRPGRRATARGVARHTDTRARGQHARAASSLRRSLYICLSRASLVTRGTRPSRVCSHSHVSRLFKVKTFKRYERRQTFNKLIMKRCDAIRDA